MDGIGQTHLAKQFTHPVIFRIPEHKRSPEGETSYVPTPPSALVYLKKH